jgi:hypothetical protein
MHTRLFELQAGFPELAAQQSHLSCPVGHTMVVVEVHETCASAASHTPNDSMPMIRRFIARPSLPLLTAAPQSIFRSFSTDSFCSNPPAAAGRSSKKTRSRAITAA